MRAGLGYKMEVNAGLYLLPILQKLLLNYFIECISSWDLNKYVTAIITDSGSNMKAAFPILAQKNQCEAI